MKRYYHTLSKNDKKKVKEKYLKEYKNTDLSKRLLRLNIFAIMGYLVSLLILFESIIREEGNIGSIIIVVTLFIASTVFLVGSYVIKLNVLNKIALKNK